MGAPGSPPGGIACITAGAGLLLLSEIHAVNAECEKDQWDRSLLWIIPVLTAVLCIAWIAYVWTALKNRKDSARGKGGKVFPAEPRSYPNHERKEESYPPTPPEQLPTCQTSDCAPTPSAPPPEYATDQSQNTAVVNVETTHVMIDHDGDGCADEVLVVQTTTIGQNEDLD
eukprot:m.13600 g.13600  ORF g.13600 m.13600 type:complete len:171 (+) comp4682_c1_seq1:2081-2593(+)